MQRSDIKICYFNSIPSRMLVRRDRSVASSAAAQALGGKPDGEEKSVRAGPIERDTEQHYCASD
jgi:hypothetical protein